MLIKPFVWWHSRWRRRRGLLNLPFKEIYGGNSHYHGVTDTSCGSKLIFLMFFSRYNGQFGSLE